MCADVLRPRATFPEMFYEREFDSTSDEEHAIATQSILRQFRSQDLYPIRVNSPCVRRHTTDNDNVILPDTEYVPKRLLNLSNTPTKRTATPNSLIEMQLNEAEVSLEECVSEWTQKIESEKAIARTRMEQLLKDHADEWDEFNHQNGVKRLSMTAPLVIEAVRKDGSPSVYRTKIGRSQVQFLEGAAAERSKAMSERQKREIITLDAQCRARVRHLEEMKKAEIQNKKERIEALAAELKERPRIRIPEGESERRPERTSTKVRLSLRNKEDLF